ncbi:DEAD/DEAH box helicase [Streptomyces phaeochromogenes]|uniref:DEAD/DEAH box helicase n=1 Tax=Streptomyces phaeochromogenes TaxID=1923 RepID=UPI002DD852C1|nr:DEAD/DEAH box helicase [Streptomyces phaeochromogenes]WRZ29537.1 DEAD/DEAH box helicase [Streptomyces phaeochromogenes]
MTLPVALTGTDVIGQAKTGTGKTLGFGLPLLERVTVPADVEAGRAKPEQLTDAPQALVVVPTRELCTQVTNDLLTAGKVRNVRVLAIYGGRAYEPQVEALKKGVDVIVGTPGRLLDLAGQRKLDLKHIKSLVLDEADEMLDLGFLPDVEKIINMLPARRQTMLFSATMPGAVIGLARRYMSQPTHIRATAPDDEGQTVRNTKQFVYRAHNMDKPEMVSRILQADGRGLVMVFCRTKRTAADLADQLQQRGFASGAVHGDLGQGAREQALRAFRNGKVDVLVCTDVAARGIDVEGVTHVINYQSPEDEKTYLHRIGRTGRAGAKGIAITLVDWDDIPRWQLINKALDLGLSDPPETYSTSPRLYEELSIPAGTKGVLPRAERTRAGLSAEVVEDLGETGGRGGPRGRGGRSGAPTSASAPVAERDRERPARTPRRRRRTRNGTPLDGTEQQTTQQTTPETTESAPAAAATEPRTPRRRRRTRSGGASEAAETAVATAEGTVAEAAEPIASAEPVAAEPRSRRRRSRRTAEAAQPEAAVVEEAPTFPVPPVAEVSEPASETRPRRRTRKSATAGTADTAAETAVDTAEGTVVEVAEAVETKPRRRTRKAAQAPEVVVEAAVEPVEAVEAKPRRTRKATTTAAAEAALDTAEATEAKPRRRTRKAAASDEVAAAVEAVEAAIPAQVAEEAEAKPRRRTRKAVTAATVAETAPVDEAPVAEAKPRRRTRKAAEVAVDTAEGTTVEAPAATATKPRRTRKTAAAAEAAVDTAEVTEAAETKPRRRARKVAVAEADIPAQATEAAPAEAPVKPRRTRKTAATVTDAVAAEAAPEAKPRRRARKTAAAATEPTES